MTKYATRGTAKRIKMSVVMPPHLVRYVRAIATRTDRSVNSVIVDVLEEAIFGDHKPTMTPDPLPAKAS